MEHCNPYPFRGTIKPDEFQAEYKFSRATAYKLLKRDPTFPRPVHPARGTTLWLRHEIDWWLESQADRGATV